MLSEKFGTMDVIRMSKDFLLDKQRSTFRGLDDRSDEEAVQGKIVVVTGASSGLGKMVALHLAKRGAIVVMGCRNSVKGQRVVDEIKSKTNNGELVRVQRIIAYLKA